MSSDCNRYTCHPCDTGRMPKRSRKEAKDPNRSAFRVVQQTIEAEKPKKNPAAVALGRLGGLKGGKARAAKMTAQERSASASKAARAMWKARAKVSAK
jgi:hypothetical protein